MKNNICSDCHSFFYYYDKAYSLLIYEGKIKQWIYAFKYGNKPVLARPFARMMSDRVIQLGIDEQFEYIISVPLY